MAASHSRLENLSKDGECGERGKRASFSKVLSFSGLFCSAPRNKVQIYSIPEERYPFCLAREQCTVPVHVAMLSLQIHNRAQTPASQS